MYTLVNPSEGGECEDYTLAFKRDGSLWGWGDRRGEFFEFLKHRSIDRPSHIVGRWDKVAMGCYEIYASQKNGTLWRWGLDEKSPVKIADKHRKKILLQKLSTTYAKISVFDMDLQARYKNNRYLGIRNNGTLWLEPIVGYK